ncbi:MAG: Hypothetical protein BHV28_07940 [Candidatus Tokpelaia hoelldobleri]|uniref:Lipoprotein n=1 Tax=Candidatus Tokpelaia hoelldobleri TaxID=1902579 RepID=A0A1U9JUG5_9HYPH|nr:MAG: Hypothetical protein BHV28_07940 [Candidatus Tokpelaia hoelldoblerii]
MWSFKTVLLVGTSLAITGCGSVKSQRRIAPPAPHPSMETTASISPVTTPGTPQFLAWERAHNAYEQQAQAYWDDVAQKRRQRTAKRKARQNIQLDDYVLMQPPVYSGPPCPATPGSAIKPPVQRAPVPGVDHFIASARQVYGYTPDRPGSEAEFMRAYANAALETGLTRNQLVALYAFETGGNGTHDLQSGMLPGKADAKPISTAIGYNQLVATASVSVMSEFGPAIAGTLRKQAAYESPARQRQLQKKAAIVDKMVIEARRVPHQWAAQAELAKTPVGLGIHAMTLDKDIGPLLQIHKLRTSVRHLHAYGIKRTVSGAELEMLNLTGDGNGLDMISMPAAFRAQVPTANFFQRTGYERNPVARRHNTVARLLDETRSKMLKNMEKEGAQALSQAFRSQILARN